MSKYDMIALYGPAALIVLALVWGFARVAYLSKAEGVSVLAFIGRERSGPELVLGVVAIILDLYLLLRPFVPALDGYAMAGHTPIGHFGVPIMAVGVGIAALSQMGMGKAWRIGVPREIETSQSLVTTGLYRFSRNPIYIGIMLFVIGGVVVIPGPITILSVIITFVFMNKVIEAEEAFLRDAFGAEFDTYCQNTRRWI